MDEYTETELLTLVAAGTDPLTALAASPSEDENFDDSPPEPSGTRGHEWIVLIILICAIVWMLFRS
jgi:hypothetical protein